MYYPNKLYTFVLVTISAWSTLMHTHQHGRHATDGHQRNALK